NEFDAYTHLLRAARQADAEQMQRMAEAVRRYDERQMWIRRRDRILAVSYYVAVMLVMTAIFWGCTEREGKHREEVDLPRARLDGSL
ncbi:hypothetical protein LPQ06_28430, partial [Klebsiella pneumoniae]|nr:hypothetical protein [Klebsiella pneumoniae]